MKNEDILKRFSERHGLTQFLSYTVYEEDIVNPRYRTKVNGVETGDVEPRPEISGPDGYIFPWRQQLYYKSEDGEARRVTDERAAIKAVGLDEAK